MPASRGWIVAALRSRWDPAALEGLAQASEAQEIAWDDLLSAAEAHQVSPLLHDRLRNEGWLPGHVAAMLRSAYVATATRNTLFLHALGDVLDMLRAQDIPVIVLKGAALAETLYGNPALRPMVDIDILLRQEDVLRGLAVLEAGGYRLARPELDPAAALAFENEIGLEGRGPLSTPLEIHWSLLDAPHYQARLPMDWFWATARSAILAGRSAQVLSPEALLLHLCAHLALHHGGSGLLWQHDIAELLAQPSEVTAPLDWSDIVARAIAWDLVLPVRDALTTVATDWRVSVPEDALAALRLTPVSPAESTVHRRLQTGHRPPARRLLDDLGEMPSWSSRLHFAFRNVFPSPSYVRIRYGVRHPVQVALAYPYRWWLGLRGLLFRR